MYQQNPAAGRWGSSQAEEETNARELREMSARFPVGTHKEKIEITSKTCPGKRTRVVTNGPVTATFQNCVLEQQRSNGKTSKPKTKNNGPQCKDKHAQRAQWDPVQGQARTGNIEGRAPVGD